VATYSLLTTLLALFDQIQLPLRSLRHKIAKFNGSEI